MKNKRLYAAIALIALFIILLIVIITTRNQQPTEQSLCVESGGEWREFSNSCADTCSFRRGEVDVCAQAITESCDCPSNQCWNGIACVSI